MVAVTKPDCHAKRYPSVRAAFRNIVSEAGAASARCKLVIFAQTAEKVQ